PHEVCNCTADRTTLRHYLFHFHARRGDLDLSHRFLTTRHDKREPQAFEPVPCAHGKHAAVRVEVLADALGVEESLVNVFGSGKELATLRVGNELLGEFHSISFAAENGNMGVHPAGFFTSPTTTMPTVVLNFPLPLLTWHCGM